MNNVVLTGNLTADAEIAVAKEKKMAKFTVAVKRALKEDAETDFIRCVAWDKIAEVAEKYAKKGGKVCVQGSWNTSRYEKDGKTVTSNYLTVYSIEVITKSVEKNSEAVPFEA